MRRSDVKPVRRRAFALYTPSAATYIARRYGSIDQDHTTETRNV